MGEPVVPEVLLPLLAKEEPPIIFNRGCAPAEHSPIRAPAAGTLARGKRGDTSFERA